MELAKQIRNEGRDEQAREDDELDGGGWAGGGRSRIDVSKRDGVVPGVCGVLIELALGGEDDDGDLGVAEDGDLVRLLEQPVPALGEGHLSVYLVLYPLQLHLAAPHRRLPACLLAPICCLVRSMLRRRQLAAAASEVRRRGM